MAQKPEFGIVGKGGVLLVPYVDQRDLQKAISDFETRFKKGTEDATDIPVDRQRARKAGEELGEEIGKGTKDADIPEKITNPIKKDVPKAGRGIGKKLALGITGALGAIGIGKFVGKELEGASNINSAQQKLQGQLALNPEETKRAGKIAGELFANNYGDSLDSVGEAFQNVLGSVGGFGKYSNAELTELTKNAINLSNAFGIDTADSVSLVQEMINDKLVPDASTGFDKLTRGLQKVPAAFRGDLIDGVREYTPYLQSLGYSADDVFNVFINGSKNGAIGMDKAGDALKEFGIRATDMSKTSVASYTALGLDAQSTADKVIKGGSSAQGAIKEISKRLLAIPNQTERSNVAIGLFGTQLEDLGTNGKGLNEFLEGLTKVPDKLGKAKGAAKGLDKSINNTMESAIGAAKNSVQLAIGDAGQGLFKAILPGIQELSAFIVDNRKEITEFGKTIGDALLPVIKEGLDGLKKVIDFVTTHKSEIKAWLPIIIKVLASLAAMGVAGKLLGGIFGPVFGAGGKLLELFAKKGGDAGEKVSLLGRVAKGVYKPIQGLAKGLEFAASKGGRLAVSAGSKIPGALRVLGGALETGGTKAAGFGTSLGGKLVGALKTTGGALSTAGGKVSGLGSKLGQLVSKAGPPVLGLFKSMGGAVGRFGGVLVRLGTLAGPALLGLLSTVGSGISAAIGAVGAALSGAFSAIGAALLPILPEILIVIAIIAVVAGLAYLIITNWDAISGFFADLWGGICAIFKASIDFIVNGFKAGVSFIVNAWKATYSFLTGVFKGIGNFFIGIWEGVINFFIGGLNTLIGAVNGFLSFVFGGLQQVASTLNTITGGFINIGFTIPQVPVLGTVSLPRFAKGGLIPARPNGTVGVFGEAGQNEIVMNEGIYNQQQKSQDQLNKALINKKAGGDVYNQQINNIDATDKTPRELQAALFSRQRLVGA